MSEVSDISDVTHRLDAENLKSRSIRGGSLMAVAQVAKLFLIFASQVLLARMLNVEAFGLIAMVTPVLGFVQIFVDLGLMQSVQQRKEITGRQLNAVFWASIVFAGVISLLMMLLAPVLAWAYGEPRIFTMTLALACLIMVNGTSLLQSAFLSRQLRFAALALCETASLFLGLTAGVISAYCGLGYWSLVVSQATISLSNALMLWSVSDWRPSRPAWSQELIPMLKFGGNITASNLTGYLNLTLDNVMIGLVLGDFALGLYDRAWKLAAQPLFQIMAPVNRVAIPVLVRMLHSQERYKRTFVQMIQVLLLVTTPGYVFLMLNAEPVIVFLFGAKWAATAPIFSWLCLGAVITPINAAIFWLFVSQERSREQMQWNMVVSLVNVSCYAIGLYWGIVGVARLSAISVYLIQSPILFWSATRAGPVDLKSLVGMCIPFAVAAAVVALFLTAMKSLGTPHTFVHLMLLSLLSYALMAVVLAVMPAGRSALKSAWTLLSALTFKKNAMAVNAPAEI